MRDVDISVSTVSRPENYLENTLQSLGPEIPLSLIVGSPSRGYLDALRRCRNCSIVTATEEEWGVIRDKSIWHRASWNYWRCLINGNKFGNGVIIFEDDIKVSLKWRARLEDTINRIEEEFEQNYVLSIYSPYRRDGYKRGLFYENYAVGTFFGTQGMYYPEKMRAGYAKYIYRFGVESYHEPYDLLLKRYLVSMKVHLFATTPSLIQHAGNNSTGLGARFHQAPSFLEVAP